MANEQLRKRNAQVALTPQELDAMQSELKRARDELNVARSQQQVVQNELAVAKQQHQEAIAELQAQYPSSERKPGESRLKYAIRLLDAAEDIKDKQEVLKKVKKSCDPIIKSGVGEMLTKLHGSAWPLEIKV